MKLRPPYNNNMVKITINFLVTVIYYINMCMHDAYKLLLYVAGHTYSSVPSLQLRIFQDLDVSLLFETF